MWFFKKKDKKKGDSTKNAEKTADLPVDKNVLGALVEPKIESVKEEPSVKSAAKAEVKAQTNKNEPVDAKPDAHKKLEKSSSKKQASPAPETLDSNIFVAGNLVKAGVFMTISILAVVGNFFIENQMAIGSDILNEEFTEFIYTESNEIPNNGVIRFDEGSNIAAVQSVSDDEYIFVFDEGDLWGNFLISDAKVNILVGKTVLIPDKAQFSIEYDGEKAILDVFDGDVYVGFLDSGLEVTDYTDQYSDIFINKLLVPRDTQVVLTMSKVTEKLSTLLTTKLVKEFKYSVIPTSVKDSMWVTTNENRDQNFLDDEKQSLVSEIIHYGQSVNDGKFAEFIFWSEENLTFVPEKKNSIIFDHLFAYLDDAIYYANEGDLESSKKSWQEFKDNLASLPISVKQSEEYIRTIDSYINRLSIFDPGDKQYFIFNELVLTQPDKYKVVNLLWRDVYASLNENDAIAEEALSNYYNEFDETLGDYEDYALYKDYITYQNQLFDNLFLRYPVFYKDFYFEIKGVIERELMDLFEEGRLKDELRQAMIDAKFDFMKRLMKFFFEEDISVDEAKKILSRLNQDIKDLMPGESNAAVLDLFESKLDDIGDFWGYLNSSEYHMLKIYGANHEEKYQSYLEDRDLIWSVIDFQEDVLGESFTEITVEDVRKEVSSILEAAEIRDYDIGGIEDVSQRYVKVNGVVGGYPFKALNDRDKISVKDVFVYDDLISDRSVKLHNLLPLIHEQFSELDEAIVLEEEQTIESIAERHARLYIRDLVVDAGFIAELEDVSVVNSEEAIYRIEQVTLETYADILVTFDYVMTEEKASNVFISVGGRPSVFEDQYTLDEVKSIIQAEADFDSDGGLVR